PGAADRDRRDADSLPPQQQPRHEAGGAYPGSRTLRDSLAPGRQAGRELMSRPGLILILMDGISSQRFAETRARLPHLDALARDGLLIERLGADTNANSMP
ncbi:hypothetical protein CWC28_21325, partial [Pseudoalteromonas sp. S4492]